MAIIKIQDTTQLTLLDDLDFIPIIDESDLSGSTAGTGKHTELGTINTWIMDKNQIVTGTWSFNNPISMSSSISSDYQLTNKLYVDAVSPWRVGNDLASATLDEPGYGNSVNSVAAVGIGGNNLVGTMSGGIYDAYGSLVIGAENVLTGGYYNLISGYDHEVHGTGHIVTGAYHLINSGDYHFLSGYRNVVGTMSSGTNAFLSGSYLNMNGQGNFMMGNVINVAVPGSPTKLLEAKGNFNFVMMTINESSTNGVIDGSYNFVTGHNHGIINSGSSYNAIVGGKDNTISSTYSYSGVIGGQNISVESSETIYVPKLEVAYDDSEIIMRSPDGTRYSLQVSNGGTFSVSIA